MKILKPGKVEQRKFVCEKCACEFVSLRTEVTWSNYGGYICCPTCYCSVTWASGEPYEDPTPTDRDRLAQLLRETRTVYIQSKVADYLIAHGVTFRVG